MADEIKEPEKKKHWCVPDESDFHISHDLATFRRGH